MEIISLEYTFEAGKFRNKSIKEVIDTDAKYLNYFLSRNADCRLSKEVIKYAQNFVNLNFNAKMIEVLTNIDSDVSKFLLFEMNTKPVKSIFTKIKASSSNKDSIIFDTPFTNNKNNTIKVGRFVKKLFELNDLKISDIEVEEFCTSFYAAFSLDKDYEMVLVKGEEIRRLYNEENYNANTGTLGNSCMRYSRCSELMDLYALNESVSMLVLLNKKSKKIAARAILWEKVKFTYRTTDGVKEMNKPFMDRVYVNSNKHTKLFFEHAKRNDWMRKKVQSYSSKKSFVYNNETIEGRMVVYVKPVGRLPYLDTVSSNTTDGLSNGYRIY